MVGTKAALKSLMNAFHIATKYCELIGLTRALTDGWRRKVDKGIEQRSVYCCLQFPCLSPGYHPHS
jgi:hypothetical protein